MASSALLSAGVVTSPAFAADGVKLGIGGFFRTAYMAVFDDDSEGELGNEHNTDGFFSDAEVHFTGSTVLDNGLTVGAHIELEGENSNDQIDEAWVYFSGGFGEFRIGSQDDALAGSCLLPPGGTDNFSAFSPNQWGANTLTSNAACIGVAKEDAQKLVYITPVFGGFQLSLSYTPSGGTEDQIDGGGPHVGMPFNTDGESRHNFSAYGTYSYEGNGWGLTAGAGASIEGHVEKSVGPDRNKQEFYQAGVNVNVGNFAVGGVFEYYNDIIDQGPSDLDRWVAGLGAAYTIDAWTLGLQYSHLDQSTNNSHTADEFQQDRVTLTGLYALGPGINIDGEVGYTWIDTDPENGTVSGTPVDNYDALEIGIGTSFTF
ncbi:MAG: porin [Dongiaceae bacterium]